MNEEENYQKTCENWRKTDFDFAHNNLSVSDTSFLGLDNVLRFMFYVYITFFILT